jgi:hypothetical protein
MNKWFLKHVQLVSVTTAICLPASPCVAAKEPLIVFANDQSANNCLHDFRIAERVGNVAEESTFSWCVSTEIFILASLQGNPIRDFKEWGELVAGVFKVLHSRGGDAAAQEHPYDHCFGNYSAIAL